MGVVAADLDDDGKIDLFVANDTTANYFFRNLGGLRFAEQGSGSRPGSQRRRRLPGGHGRGLRRPRRRRPAGPGRDQLLRRVDHALPQPRQGVFQRPDGCGRTGRRRPASCSASAWPRSTPTTTADLDLAQANGHVGDYRPGIPYAMPAQLFLGDRTGTLIDVSDRAGPPWQLPRLARGLAAGDVDNDGRIDIVLASENAPIGLLHNQPTTPKEDRAARDDHFVIFQLEGTKSNRDAVGARVKVTTAGRSQVAERFGGGSYASAGDQRLHFGLGKNRVIDHVEVAWPSGRRDRLGRLAVDKGYRLREGNPTPLPLGGF